MKDPPKTFIKLESGIILCFFLNFKKVIPITQNSNTLGNNNNRYLSPVNSKRISPIKRYAKRKIEMSFSFRSHLRETNKKVPI